MNKRNRLNISKNKKLAILQPKKNLAQSLISLGKALYSLGWDNIKVTPVITIDKYIYNIYWVKSKKLIDKNPSKNPKTRKEQLRQKYIPLKKNKSSLKVLHIGLWAKRAGKNIIKCLYQRGVRIGYTPNRVLRVVLAVSIIPFDLERMLS